MHGNAYIDHLWPRRVRDGHRKKREFRPVPCFLLPDLSSSKSAAYQARSHIYLISLPPDITKQRLKYFNLLRDRNYSIVSKIIVFITSVSNNVMQLPLHLYITLSFWFDAIFIRWGIMSYLSSSSVPFSFEKGLTFKLKVSTEYTYVSWCEWRAG